MTPLPDPTNGTFVATCPTVGPFVACGLPGLLETVSQAGSQCLQLRVEVTATERGSAASQGGQPVGPLAQPAHGRGDVGRPEADDPEPGGGRQLRSGSAVPRDGR